MIPVPPTTLGIVLIVLLLFVSPGTILVTASLVAQSLLYKRPVPQRRRFLITFVFAPFAAIAIGALVWVAGLHYPSVFEFTWRFALLTIPFALLEGVFRVGAYLFPSVGQRVPTSSRIGVVIVAESLLLLVIFGAFDPLDRHAPPYREITVDINHEEHSTPPQRGSALSWVRFHLDAPDRMGAERAVYIEAIVDFACLPNASACPDDKPAERYRAELQTVGMKTTQLSVGRETAYYSYPDLNPAAAPIIKLYDTRLSENDVAWQPFDANLSLVAGAWLMLPEHSGPQSLLVRLHYAGPGQPDRVIAEGIAHVDVTSADASTIIDVAGKLVPILGAVYGAAITILGVLRRNRKSASDIVVAT